jgi:SNF2 family DNA or RNA helicase
MRMTSPQGTSPKIAFLVGDILACGPGEHGVLVYCDWHSEMNLIREELLSQGMRCFVYNGKMALCEREDCIRSFRSAVSYRELKCAAVARGAVEDTEFPPPCVLIIQSKSGSVGLNLQDSAARLYIMRPQYNPSIEYQSICRIHRRGQTRPVTVIQLVAVGTIDEVCFERQTAKLACISDVMNDDGMTRILRRGGV